jgi:Cu+-exporting ATPase
MTTTVHDPVCGMDIDPATAAGTSEHNGQTYYFCSLGCKKTFDKEPEKYLGRLASTLIITKSLLSSSFCLFL